MIQLNERYNREDFLNFLNNDFLSDFEKDVRPANSEGFSVITKATYLGKSKLLDLHIFELSYSESHANKRVTLAMDGFRIMKSTATFNALIIFNPANKNKWRLSLMTASPKKNEKGGVSVHLSNPRRFSFELGENTKINTPFNFLIKKGTISDLNDLKKRFSIEVVNKEFYSQISELFTELVGGTRGEGRNQLKYTGVIALPSVPKESRENHEFAVRLIGRLIFCWFLREKKSDSSLPLISKEILSFDATNNNPDYYHSILEPLFFEVLNKPSKLRSEEYKNGLFGKTPYLNGGLFTPQAWDYYDSKLRFILKVPDEWIRKLFEVLELYNFTVDENTSVDIDLSIDPEMLGRIFENLLAEINPETGETARKSTGSYYTPRAIVDYMVDESLIQYLKDKTSIDENKLRVLVSYDLNDDEEYPLKEDEKNKVVESLSKITILDPACGSGAFPIGALQKIVLILQRIDQDAKLWFKQQIEGSAPEIKRIIEREFAEKNFDYIRKLGIIRESIFGIDIQPIATEIARLRCFLTLIVDERVDDEEENRGIEPLPNLDFKFVTANSLIGLPNSQANSQVGLFEDQEGINKLKEVRDIYFNASGTEREQLKLQFVQIQNKMFQRMIQEHTLAELTQKLSSWNPFGHEASDWFDPDWMFGVNKGFDIVIANPPYINIFNIKDGAIRDYLASHYSVARNKTDLYAFFVEQGNKLLKPQGALVFIFSNSWLGTDSFSKFRAYLIENTKINQLIKCPPGVFEEATVTVVIIVLTKEHVEHNNIRLLELRDGKFEDIPFFLSYDFIKSQISYGFTFNKQLTIKIPTITLGSIAKFSLGIKTSDDKKFILNSNKDRYCHKMLRGKDVSRWFYSFANKWMWYRPELMNKRKGAGPRNLEYFLKTKILIRDIANEIQATIDDNRYLTTDTISIIHEIKDYDLKFILGLLNSRIINKWFKLNFDAGLHIKINQLQNVPIPTNVNLGDSKKIIELVGKILVITKTNDYSENPEKKEKVKDYEKQIDELVYKLYGLTPKEITVVKG